MAVFESLTPAERARQLRNPEGAVGLAVAEWLNETNRGGNARIVALLGLGPGSHVLEIGFGNGRTVPDVIAQAAGVHYTDLDFSPTMVEEATRFNAALVAAGRASFHLGSVERTPFADASFDRVFSTASRTSGPTRSGRSRKSAVCCFPRA
jgi:SAM-dependent methyltransferase